MNLEYGWLHVQMRPRVMHRLPGRLRLHIPALKKVSEEYHIIATTLLKGFKKPQGIQDAHINYVTGNILVRYEQKKREEREVINWILDIKNMVADLFIKFINMPDQEIEPARIKLTEFLEESSRNGTVIDKHFEIPDEIWD